VETLANLALIARFGPGWFREAGLDAEPGTAVVTLGGAVRRPGIYELPLGLPLAELLDSAGGLAEPVSAFLVGGYFGGWVAAADAASLRLSEADLAARGGGLGARALYALPERACGVFETARVARYLGGESAGQCGPCVHGLAAIADALERLAWNRDPDAADVARIERWSGQIDGRGACRHPDGAVRFVGSALRVFRRELELHLRRRCTGDRQTVASVLRRSERRR